MFCAVLVLSAVRHPFLGIAWIALTSKPWMSVGLCFWHIFSFCDSCVILVLLVNTIYVLHVMCMCCVDRYSA